MTGIEAMALKPQFFDLDHFLKSDLHFDLDRVSSDLATFTRIPLVSEVESEIGHQPPRCDFRFGLASDARSNAISRSCPGARNTGTKYGYDKDGKPFLTKESKLLLNDNDAGKPEGIHLEIGRRPHLATRPATAKCWNTQAQATVRD